MGEEWIRHHRQSASSGRAPCCSVCHQAYQGQEARPGVADFAKSHAHYARHFVLRMLVLSLVLWANGQAENRGMPLAVRVVLNVVVAAYVIQKLVVFCMFMCGRPALLPFSIYVRVCLWCCYVRDR